MRKLLLIPQGLRQNARKTFHWRAEKALRHLAQSLGGWGQRACALWPEFQGLCIQVLGSEEILDHSFIHSLNHHLFLPNSSKATECYTSVPELVSGYSGKWEGKVLSCISGGSDSTTAGNRHMISSPGQGAVDGPPELEAQVFSVLTLIVNAGNLALELKQVISSCLSLPRPEYVSMSSGH